MPEAPYFTARIKYNPARPKEAFNQDRYLEALTAYPLVRVIEGFYKRFKIKLPFAKEPCKSCDRADYGVVWKTEEKRSDVNLATLVRPFTAHMAREFGVSRSSVSRELRSLREYGAVERVDVHESPKTLTIYYRLKD